MTDTENSLPERLKEKVAQVIPTQKSKKSKEPKEVKPPAPKRAKPPNDEPEAPRDPDSMFKEGFLKNVREEIKATPIFTRFPPEPNGALHIGHAKAIAINFGFARFHGGECYLRYDDTNPEAEKDEYLVSIASTVRWLGFNPFKTTYASDNFDKLYEFAEHLIESDHAYVCVCTDADLKDQRGGVDHGELTACNHRDRPTSESLAEFRAMRDGKYRPKEAFLRFKRDPKSGNPYMRDNAAYRVLDSPHHRTGAKWKIYPTYEFAHPLCDYLEGITHSLCTVEFEPARYSYEWLLTSLNLVNDRPVQREYGRLNVTGIITSKRRILKLVALGHVRGLDDPRLYTLPAIRRRGVPPEAVLGFVNELGVSKALTSIQTVKFEYSVRKHLETTVPRLMLVLDPVPVILDNLPDDYSMEVDVEFPPKDLPLKRKIPFTKVIYIDRIDFREHDNEDYFRLAPDKSVPLLKVNGSIKATSFKKDPVSGLVTEIHADYDEQPLTKKTKKKNVTYLQWVAESSKYNSPVKAEVRVFNPLFQSEQPESAEGGFLNDIRENSEENYAMVEIGLRELQRNVVDSEGLESKCSIKSLEVGGPDGVEAGGAMNGGENEKHEISSQEVNKMTPEPGPEDVRFQALRIGYFCMDRDTTTEKVVLNRIVGLKEDVGKTT